MRQERSSATRRSMARLSPWPTFAGLIKFAKAYICRNQAMFEDWEQSLVR